MAYIDTTLNDFIIFIFIAIIACSLAYIIYNYATKEKIEKFGVPLWVWLSVITFFATSAWIIYSYLGVKRVEDLEEINYVIVALVAFVGSPFFIWRAMLTNKQTENAQRQTENAQRQTQIQQESEHTKNYFEAMKQLDFEDGKDDEKITLRAGAIYGLGNIAENSKDHHLQIIKLLESYIRKNTLGKKGTIGIDTIVAFEVIGRRNEKWIKEIEYEERYQLNFSNLSLLGIRFPPNMNFANASFLNTNLQHAYLQDANLQDTKLIVANLCGANLSNAKNLPRDLTFVFGDGATRLPAGLANPRHWPKKGLNNKRSEEEWRRWQNGIGSYEPPTE